MDHLEFIMRLEGDSDEPLGAEEYVNGIAAMIKDGTVWRLQGFYGRLAHDLIESGCVDAEGDVLCYPEDAE